LIEISLAQAVAESRLGVKLLLRPINALMALQRLGRKKAA